MEKQRSKFMEWTVYCLAIVALAILIYVFATMNQTKIVPESIVSGDFHAGVPDKSHLHNEASSLADLSPAPESSDDTKEPPQQIKNIENDPRSRSVLKENKNTQDSHHVHRNKPSKSSSQKNVAYPSHNKAVNPCLGKHSKVKCEAAVSIKKLKKKHPISIRYCADIHLYKSPVRVAVKAYNRRVIQHFKEKPSQKIFAIGTYKIRRGDNIYTLGGLFQVRAIDIIAINNNIKDPDNLKIGKTILVPSTK